MSDDRTPVGASVASEAAVTTDGVSATTDVSQQPLPPVATRRRRRPTHQERELDRALVPAEDARLVPVTQGIAPGSPTPTFIEPILNKPMTKDGKRWKTVQAAIALSVECEDRAEIAKRLGISPRALANYFYEARKAGLLGTMADPRDEIEFSIVPKAVRNLDAMLDHENFEIKERATNKVLDATVFRPTVAAAPALMGLQINVVQPEGTPIAIREGTIKGRANFIDAESADAE